MGGGLHRCRGPPRTPRQRSRAGRFPWVNLLRCRSVLGRNAAPSLMSAAAAAQIWAAAAPKHPRTHPAPHRPRRKRRAVRVPRRRRPPSLPGSPRPSWHRCADRPACTRESGRGGIRPVQAGIPAGSRPPSDAQLTPTGHPHGTDLTLQAHTGTHHIPVVWPVAACVACSKVASVKDARPAGTPPTGGLRLNAKMAPTSRARQVMFMIAMD